MLKTTLRLYDWVHYYEKMLYDNALLVRAYLHAWQVTKELAFKRTVEEMLDFVQREMTHPDGGFFSSLDADSEGVEGKFYVSTLDEIRETLKEDSEFFEAADGITAKRNWEGKTILQRALDDSSLAARFGIATEVVPAKLADSHRRLLALRARRVRPGTDDKIITAWNDLILAAFAEAARVISRDDGTVATRNAGFLLTALRPSGLQDVRRAGSRRRNMPRGKRTSLQCWAKPKASVVCSRSFEQNTDRAWSQPLWSFLPKKMPLPCRTGAGWWMEKRRHTSAQGSCVNNRQTTRRRWQNN